MSYEDSYRININGELEKRCSICREWFLCTEENFYKNDKNNIDGLFPYCKTCTSLKSQKWQIENPEQYAKIIKHRNSNPPESVILFWNNNARKQRESGYARNWQRRNPDKIKQYNSQHQNHKITNKEWKNCKLYFNMRCAYCGLPIEEHWVKIRGNIQLGDFHKEHVDHNGSNALDNCVPSCKRCNSSKRQNKLEEWYNQENPGFTLERYEKIIKWLSEDYKKYIE